MNALKILPRQNHNPWSILSHYIALQAPTTQRQYKNLVAEFVAYLGGDMAAISEILPCVTPDDCRQYLAWSRARPAQAGRSAEVCCRVSEGTVYRKVAILSSLFEVLASEKMITENPFDSIRAHVRAPKIAARRPHEPVPVDRVPSLLSRCPGTKKGIRDRALFALLFGGALRVSETVGLRLSDVTQYGDVVVLRLTHTKAQETQHQVIDWGSESVLALVAQRRLEGAAESCWLVVNYVGDFEDPTETALSVETVRRRFKAYCRDAKLAGVHTPHSARATAITKLLDDGVSHREVQEFSRHSSVQMVERYDKRRTSIETATARKLKY